MRPMDTDLASGKHDFDEDLVSEAEIDAGAAALRERMQSGRITRPWDALPKSDKRKWRDYAAVVLTAARALQRREDETGDGR